MKLNIGFFIFISILSLYYQSCKISEKTTLSPIEILDDQLKEIEDLNNSFTGFVLYEVNKSKEVININGEKLFTPASNTKILTFYTALNVLKDSCPVIKYFVTEDSLFFWGTGNPSTLNNSLSYDTTVIEFLRKRNIKLFFCENNFTDKRFGNGWAWDDYLHNYQLEKSPLPLYGNKITVQFTSDSTYLFPELMRKNTSFVSDSFLFTRSFDKNDFLIGKFRNGYDLTIPFKTDGETIVSLISQLINKPVVLYKDVIRPTEFKKLRHAIYDSMYIRLLHESDNFIAEQLLLMCSSELFDTLDVKKSIGYSVNNLMPFLKDSCRWVDGSGLSRYNLLKPNSIIRALILILDKVGIDKIKIFFPQIKTSKYNDLSIPEQKQAGVYAKSGSLGNNYNLSGYIITKKSNTYIFSFMNNHFLKNSSIIKLQIQKTLDYIVENY